MIIIAYYYYYFLSIVTSKQEDMFALLVPAEEEYLEDLVLYFVFCIELKSEEKQCFVVVYSVKIRCLNS